MGFRTLILLLVVLLCLELALAGKRGQWKKTKKFRNRRPGDDHAMHKGRARLPMEKRKLGHLRKFEEKREHRRGPSRVRDKFAKAGCNKLTAIMNSVNETLPHRRHRLHSMFSALLNRAQMKYGYKSRRRAYMEKALRYELDKLVEHQCLNAMRMVNMLETCNASGLVSFEHMWHHQYQHVYSRLSKRARKRSKGLNATEMCRKVSTKPLGFRRGHSPHPVRNLCQRLELLKCIFKSTNITLPAVSFTPPVGNTQPPRPIQLHPKTDDDDDHEHKSHKHGKIILGIGALLLLLLAAALFVCFLRYRKKLHTREKCVEKLETVAKENKEVWTTPPDSTVAWLQAKGWRNPVYYTLEEEAMKSSKVAI